MKSIRKLSLSLLLVSLLGVPAIATSFVDNSNIVQAKADSASDDKREEISCTGTLSVSTEHFTFTATSVDGDGWCGDAHSSAVFEVKEGYELLITKIDFHLSMDADMWCDSTSVDVGTMVETGELSDGDTAHVIDINSDKFVIHTSAYFDGAVIYYKDAPNDQQKAPIGLIIGISAGSLFGALLIAYIVMFIIWKKTNKGLKFLIPSFKLLSKKSK